MLTVISPAKRLDEGAKALPEGITATEPTFADAARELAGVAARLSPAELGKLMDISPALSDLNRARFAAFGGQTRVPAALIFAGDTYAGLEAAGLSADAWRWAGLHLRILSGLYGLLRPTDLIEPYRLEMGSRLANPRGKSLYDYWGSDLAHALNRQAEEVGARYLLNCASIEYVSAVDPAALRLPMVTPIFLEGQEGAAKVISFWAKKARGAMARFVMENRITDPADLCDFDLGGYRFQPAASEPGRLVFRREGQAALVAS
ncbi:peroxide stress protein YaaA [Gemmobacter serpentinus]|uniref:peroxide stress protein YaaA n=1 Tax=Gemmobacter serpentinus TaxID=2652247 RepID=UPI00124E57AA|nr:peroxide stress protein YaaA [Gemmobacter serpentinus]